MRFPRDAFARSKPQDFATAKGPVFHTAIVAGTMAAKRTHELIPFCHPLGLERCDIAIDAGRQRRARDPLHGRGPPPHRRRDGGADRAPRSRRSRVYDMCKSLSHGIVIESLRLLEKSGGKGDFAAGSRAMTAALRTGPRRRPLDAACRRTRPRSPTATRPQLAEAFDLVRAPRCSRAFVSVRADQAGEPLRAGVPAGRRRDRGPRSDRGHHRGPGAASRRRLAGRRLRPAAARRRDARRLIGAARPGPARDRVSRAATTACRSRCAPSTNRRAARRSSRRSRPDATARANSWRDTTCPAPRAAPRPRRSTTPTRRRTRPRRAPRSRARGAA